MQPFFISENMDNQLGFSVYILFSNKLNRFYIGTTDDVEKRLIEHNYAHYPQAYTVRGIPWSLFFTIENLSSSQAFQIEKHIKKMKSKKYISDLKKYPEIVLNLQAKYSVAGSSR